MVFISIPRKGILITMIDKYQNNCIKHIWSDKNKFSLMEQIEYYWLDAVAEHLKLDINNTITRELNVNQIKAYELQTKHEVVAFLQEMEDRLSCTNAKKYLHYNLTSSDLLDSTATLQHTESFNEFKYLYYELRSTISQIIKDDVYSDVYQIGRTHSRYAEKIKLVSRFKNLQLGIDNSFTSLKAAIASLPGKLSGPVGHSNMPLNVRRYPADQMGFKLSEYAMQIVPRQFYTEITFHLSNLATWYEKFCTDLRLLSFDEISEMQEGFDRYQWGSSAMPHKKNPIVSERICGLSRLLRQSLSTSMQNNVSWLERDISHSSTERINWENQWHLICYMTKLMTNLLKDLNINLGNIERNLNNAIMSVEDLNSNIVKYSSRTEAYEQTRKLIYDSKTSLQAKNVDLFEVPSVPK